MNKTVRIGLASASLLASLVGLAPTPATAEDQVRPADPSLVQAPAAQDQTLAADEQIAPADDPTAGDDQTPAAAEKRGHRPPPPPPSLATFTGVVAVGRTRYTYTMVGTNPELRRAQNVAVPVVIVPLRLEFQDGTVLDPTAPDTCLGGRVPVDVTLQSPLFQDYDYGEGPRQFVEQIRRMEFWQFTGPHKLNPGYSVRLGTPTILPTQTLTLSSASFTEAMTCRTTGDPETMGHIDINDFDNFLQSQLVPQFPKWGVNAGTFVVLHLPFADFYQDGTEAAYSYHSFFNTPQGKITYAAAQLGLALPGDVVNIGPMSHEFAEWLDDPYIDNGTPPWGNIGQVTGCQPILEVGDPLTGTFLPLIKMPNGISYQPQETAFFSWFFDQVPSLGFNGWYSTNGTFKKPAAPCH
jgi:hypothetical protein